MCSERRVPDTVLVNRPRSTDIAHLVFLNVLSYERKELVDLTAAGLKRPRGLSPYAKQDHLRHIAKIEPHATPVRSTILTNLVPNQVGLVGEIPSIENLVIPPAKVHLAPRVKGVPYHQETSDTSN